jgi:hypothetical protein
MGVSTIVTCRCAIAAQPAPSTFSEGAQHRSERERVTANSEDGALIRQWLLRFSLPSICAYSPRGAIACDLNIWAGIDGQDRS